MSLVLNWSMVVNRCAMTFIIDFGKDYVNKNYDWDAAMSRATGETTTVNKVDKCSVRECCKRKLMNYKRAYHARMFEVIFCLMHETDDR